MATSAVETAKQENGSRVFFESVIENSISSGIFGYFSSSSLTATIKFCQISFLSNFNLLLELFNYGVESVQP